MVGHWTVHTEVTYLKKEIMKYCFLLPQTNPRRINMQQKISRIKRGLNNVLLLPTYCSMFKTVDKIELCWQQNFVESCFHQPWTNCLFYCCVDPLEHSDIILEWIEKIDTEINLKLMQEYRKNQCYKSSHVNIIIFLAFC